MLLQCGRRLVPLMVDVYNNVIHLGVREKLMIDTEKSFKSTGLYASTLLMSSDLRLLRFCGD